MNWYAILTAVGIVVLLLGLAMSPTETQTTTTCVDSGYQYGSGCIDTTYEAPNPARGLFVGGGFFLALVAGSLWVKNRGITTKPRDDVGPVRQPQSSHTPQNGPSAGPDAGTDPTTADPDDDKPTTSADGEYQRLYHRHRRVSAMENVELERSLPDTIDTAKLAFELTDGIETYHQSGNRIVGKTGVSFGSYGETVVVDCKTLRGGPTDAGDRRRRAVGRRQHHRQPGQVRPALPRFSPDTRDRTHGRRAPAWPTTTSPTTGPRRSPRPTSRPTAPGCCTWWSPGRCSCSS